jgi:DNA-nicking Smr family endonuclease
VSGARPLHRSDEEPVRQEERQATTEQQNAGEQDVQLFLDAMRAPGAATFREQSFDDDEDGAGRRSPSSRMRQLKKGSIRIGQELDLHGFLKDEALRRLEQFIAAAVVRGLEAVLVITGKGTNSPGGPVLQGAVAQWLRGAGARYAAEFHPAPRDRGGSGAFVVFLKNRKT